MEGYSDFGTTHFALYSCSYVSWDEATFHRLIISIVVRPLLNYISSLEHGINFTHTSSCEIDNRS